VNIGHDVKGGSGDDSGKIDSGGTLGPVTIGGSLLGGSGAQNTFMDSNNVVHGGQIFGVGDSGAVTIDHNVQGADGVYSGAIVTFAKLAGISVGGSILGGGSDRAGASTRGVGRAGGAAVTGGLTGTPAECGNCQGHRLLCHPAAAAWPAG